MQVSFGSSAKLSGVGGLGGILGCLLVRRRSWVLLGHGIWSASCVYTLEVTLNMNCPGGVDVLAAFQACRARFSMEDRHSDCACCEPLVFPMFAYGVSSSM